MKSNKKKLIWLVKFVVGLSLMGWVLLKVDWLDFFERTQDISFSLLAVLLTCTVADRCLMGFKWNLLLRANGLQIGTLRIICLYFVSNFLGAFTPGNIGADAYRLVALSSYEKNSAVLSTIILERAIGMLIQLIFVMATLPFSLTLLGANGPLVAWLAVLGAGGIVLLLFLPLYPPLRKRIDCYFAGRQTSMAQKIHRFFTVFSEQQKNMRVLAVFFFLTVIEATLFFYISYLVAKVGGLTVSLAFVFSVMPIVMFILRLPISIQGIGLQEGLFAYSFSLAGNSIAQGVLASLIWRLQEIVAIYIPGWLFFLFYPAINNKENDSSVSKFPDN